MVGYGARGLMELLGLTITFIACGAIACEAPAATAPVSTELGADGVQRLSIRLDSYSFTPSHIIVTADKPVELTLENVARLAPHNLKIDAADLTVSQDVKARKTEILRFTPTKRGTFEFYCDKSLLGKSHRDRGMVGKLEVR